MATGVRKPAKKTRTRNTKIAVEDVPQPIQEARCTALANKLTFDPKNYEYSEAWVPANLYNPKELHSTQELLEALKKDKNKKLIEVEARVIAPAHKKGEGYRLVKLNQDQFLEYNKQSGKSKKFREAVDNFALDNDVQAVSGLVGEDFVPLLGGPFNKQLYYTDYLRMHAAAFHAYNHDPLGRATVHITRDFTIGRGYRIDFDGPEKPRAEILWASFCEINNMDTLVEKITEEIAIYGEVMLWELPDNQKYIYQNPVATDTNPKGLMSRYKLIDPSVIWEIVTHPEDIDRVLYYQWVAPTQYQQYTDGKQPTLKFIYQQIPRDQVLHFKVNNRSNEKRGRSDYFPALGYMKRLRDSVNYSIIALQKASAWSMDTTIEGDQGDIDDYVNDQKTLGTIPPAGSEFIHTAKIKRQYLSNDAAGRSGNSTAFDWCMSMVSISTGIPMNYYGSHLNASQNRASALVATEPVAKKMEQRQDVISRIIKSMLNRFIYKHKLKVDYELTWPEIVTEDRSVKLKDLGFAQANKWISRKRASQISAKELSIDNYDYLEEKALIEQEAEDDDIFAPPAVGQPLSSPGLVKTNSFPSDEKKKIKDNKGF